MICLNLPPVPAVPKLTESKLATPKLDERVRRPLTRSQSPKSSDRGHSPLLKRRCLRRVSLNSEPNERRREEPNQKRRSRSHQERMADSRTTNHRIKRKNSNLCLAERKKSPTRTDGQSFNRFVAVQIIPNSLSVFAKLPRYKQSQSCYDPLNDDFWDNTLSFDCVGLFPMFHSRPDVPIHCTFFSFIPYFGIIQRLVSQIFSSPSVSILGLLDAFESLR